MPPDRGLMDKQSSGVKGSKKRLTYTFTMNATGTEKLPPFIIGKAARPRPFKRKSGAQLGLYYRSNAKAWMTTVLYQEWLQEWDKKLRREGRKILLLQDNFSGHIPPANLTNISVENFEPNLTAHVQPADAGIIRCFKAHYRARFMNRAIDRYDFGISPANIYDIDILESIRMAEMAWEDVTETTIYNCWRKSGILPDMVAGALLTESDVTATSDLESIALIRATPSIPITSLLNNNLADPTVVAENQVLESLAHLATLGMLQQHNRMSLDEILNPANEENMYMNTGTDEDSDIYQAVLERRDAEQNLEISLCGDDIILAADNLDDDIAGTQKPSRREALSAASIICKYIVDSDKLFARQVEAILASFGRQTRFDEVQSLKPTTINDYFAPKA
jgi:DDE superfamily endonuclease